MSYTLDQILAAAQTIRPQLFNLLDAETATAIDRQLATLIEQAHSDTSIENQILVLLSQHAVVREQASTLLNAETVPTDPTRLFERLPGASVSQEFPRFKCAICGSIWSQLELHEPIPLCEADQTHGVLQPI
jgi:hypothetical protein